MEMKYCMECGCRLEDRYLEHEGIIPYCPSCGEYRFPVFNTAVSMIVMNEKKDRMILIRQYGGTSNILTAGYVNRGEDAEDAVRREVMEELGMEVTSIRFNHSRYFKPSNTLMLNWTVTVRGEPHPNYEIDSWKWFTIEEAREQIKPDSLAKSFLLGYLDGHYEFR